jgi:hypothetical protein
MSCSVVTFIWIGILLTVSANSKLRFRSRPMPIYSNQFAVHVPAGAKVASSIAEKHGFDNHGQVRYSLILNVFLYMYTYLFDI